MAFGKTMFAFSAILLPTMCVALSSSAAMSTDFSGVEVLRRHVHVEVVNSELMHINCACGNITTVNVIVEEVQMDETRMVIRPNGTKRVIAANSKTIKVMKTDITRMQVPVQPSASYRYKLSDDEEWRAFRAPPRPSAGASLRVAIVGGMNEATGVPNTCASLAKAHKEIPFDVATILADSKQAENARFEEDCDDLPWLIERPEIAEGADESSASSASAQSGNGRYFSTRLGPAHVVTLDPSDDLEPESPQMQWFDKELNNVDRATTPYVVVMSRTENSDSDTGTIGLADREHRLLQRVRKNVYDSQVDFVFGSHGKGYQRTVSAAQGLVDLNIDGKEGHSQQDDASLPEMQVDIAGWGRLQLDPDSFVWNMMQDSELRDHYEGYARRPISPWFTIVVCIILVVIAYVAVFFTCLWNKPQSKNKTRKVHPKQSRLPAPLPEVAVEAGLVEVVAPSAPVRSESVYTALSA